MIVYPKKRECYAFYYDKEYSDEQFAKKFNAWAEKEIGLRFEVFDYMPSDLHTTQLHIAFRENSYDYFVPIKGRWIVADVYNGTSYPQMMFKNYTEYEFSKIFVSESKVNHYIIKDLKTSKYVSLFHHNIVLTDKEASASKFGSKNAATRFINNQDLMSRDKKNFEIIPVCDE